MGDHTRGEWSLVFFTILTQLAVGIFVLWGLAAGLLPSPNSFNAGLFPVVLLYTVLSTLILGVMAATTHLGRPIGAIFSLNNLRSSWLSREALLAVWFGLVVLVALVLQLTGGSFGFADRLVIFIGLLSGFGLVLGISRLYRLRTVPAWDNHGTPLTFITTSILGGVVVNRLIWSVLVIQDAVVASEPVFDWIVRISNLLVFLLVLIQAAIFGLQMIYLSQQGGAGAESVRILWHRYRNFLVGRWLAAAAGVLFLNFWDSALPHLLAFFLLLASEVIGRFLFYAFYQRTGY